MFKKILNPRWIRWIVFLVFVLICAICAFIYYSLSTQTISTLRLLHLASTRQNATSGFLNNVGNQSRLINLKHLQLPETESAKIACNWPRLDPFDSSIKEYVELPDPVNCSDNPSFPPIYTTDLRSTLIQVNDPASYGLYNCCWNSFRRKSGSDYDVELSEECMPINEKETRIPEIVEYIEISCDYVDSSVADGEPLNNTRKIVDIFGFMHLKPSVEKRIAADLKRNRSKQGSHRRNLNVVIFGLDAVARLNFIRNFPLTFEYMTQNLSAMGMSGMTKVGENTFPNVVPALTGLSVDELGEKADCWRTSEDILDECPFIWNDFSRQGFRTAYGEDAVDLGIFNYAKGGFGKQPTDYYINNMNYQSSQKINHHSEGRNSDVCYGSKFSCQILLDFLKQMAILMNPHKRYFQFVWSTAITHDYLMDGFMEDKYLVETLQFFHNQGFLDNTAFVLMSDHGMSCEGIVDTFQGKIEERMPFAYFILPEWFQQEYPQAIENLIRNEYKLTTHFDIYETLLDILFLDNLVSQKLEERQFRLNSQAQTNTNNPDLNSTSNSSLPRGISLFLAIPPKRTCADAGIVDQYCVCKTIQSLDAKDNLLVVKAAENIVHYVNGLLSNFPECAQLHFLEALNAQLEFDDIALGFWEGITDETDPRLKENKLVMKLSVKVAPSNATFQATVTRQINGKWEVSQEIGRTNLYGKQSWCIAPSKLEKYCFCTEVSDQ